MSPPGAHLGSVGREVVPEGGPLRAPAPPAQPATAARSTIAAQADQRWATWIQLAAFLALAAFAAGHWAALVEAPSRGRTLLVVLVATAGAAALIALGAPSLRSLLTRRLGERPRAAGAGIVAAALLIGLGTILLGLGAAGLPLRLLGPGNWGELADGLDRGLAGLQTVEWPYDGPEEWIRLTILLGAPLLLGLAALLAFFPARRGRALLNGLGLVLLLVAYGTAVTEHDPGSRCCADLRCCCSWAPGCGFLACARARRRREPRRWWRWAFSPCPPQRPSTEMRRGGTTAPGICLARAR